ncbi:MAG: YlxR family protein [Lachnospiraceae bacterium]|nr:YlxR family protein [Lachnospiraceae bacterium]
MQQITKKRPARTCLGCRNSKDKRELIRIVRTPEGEIKLDLSGKMNGRGAYLCRNKGCLEKAFRSRALGRALKSEIPEEIYEKLSKEAELAE